MKYNPDGTIRAYATFRVAGDQLIPDEITDILRTYPTLSYKKGERYTAGKNAGEISGRTGVWYIATDKIVSSTNLLDHITHIASILIPEKTLGINTPVIIGPGELGKAFHRLGKLQSIIQRRELEAVMSLFWHGAIGARPPSIPRAISSLFRYVPITIEPDFDTDEISDRDVA